MLFSMSLFSSSYCFVVLNFPIEYWLLPCLSPFSNCCCLVFPIEYWLFSRISVFSTGYNLVLPYLAVAIVLMFYICLFSSGYFLVVLYFPI